MGTLEQENAKLERLREYLSSDDHLQRRAEPHRGKSPEEGLAEVFECCEMAEWFRVHRDQLAKELPQTELPPDTLALLERLQR